MEQNRFKSWALWVIASAFGLPEKMGITESTFTRILDAIGSILIAFGICNNPTDSENF